MLFLEEVKSKFPTLKNIFEIGAHRGNDISKILKLWPDSNVFAFEADPFNYEITKNKFANDKNVNVYHCAVGGIDGEVSFFRYYPVETIPDEYTNIGQNLQHTGIGSILKPGKGLKEIFKVLDPHEELKVQSTTLLTFCNNHNVESLDAIFMDIQGAEYMAFLGCNDLLQTVKATIFEWSRDYILYDGEQSLENITSLLNDNGLFETQREYQIKNISGDSLFIRGDLNG